MVESHETDGHDHCQNKRPRRAFSTLRTVGPARRDLPRSSSRPSASARDAQRAAVAIDVVQPDELLKAGVTQVEGLLQLPRFPPATAHGRHLLCPWHRQFHGFTKPHTGAALITYTYAQ